MQDQPVPRERDIGFIGRLEALGAVLTRANNLMIEVVGPPEDAEDPVAKEPNSLTEKLSLLLWGVEHEAHKLVGQIERLQDIIT